MLKKEEVKVKYLAPMLSVLRLEHRLSLLEAYSHDANFENLTESDTEWGA